MIVLFGSCVLYSQVSQLNTLIGHLLGELTKGDRQKIMTICTIDVHARDVVAKLISQKVDNSQAFIWLSQLRHRYTCVCCAVQYCMVCASLGPRPIFF